MKTHCDKSITQCQVVRPANRPEKLLKEASLQYIQTNLDHTVLLNTHTHKEEEELGAS